LGQLRRAKNPKTLPITGYVAAAADTQIKRQGNIKKATLTQKKNQNKTTGTKRDLIESH